MPNRRLFDTFEARVALAKVFRRFKPKVVIGFGGKTVLASPDHYQAMLITDAAVFYSRLTKWDEYFDGLPTHTVINQLSFPIALHGLDLPEASGYIVADIGSTLEVKLEAIRAYQTQFPASKAGIFRAVEAMNRYQGLTAGFRGGRSVHDLSLRRRGRSDALGQPGACSSLSVPWGPRREPSHAGPVRTLN